MTATGAVNRGLPAHTELERWYRRLLQAYPVGYRRAYGDEILSMLMDSAEPGRRRPARADVADLAGDMLRQWFRLPTGPTAVVVAVLAALVLGAVGAAAGSWLAWQTAAELPSDTAVGQIDAVVGGVPYAGSAVQRSDGRGEIWPSVSVYDESLLTGWTLEAAQARLRADGWTPGQMQQSDASAYLNDVRLAGVYQVFEATRDGQTVTGYAQTITTPGVAAGTRLEVRIHPAEPASVPLVTAVGWLVGAIVAWLLTGWAGYRLRRRALPRRLAAWALGLTALGLAAHPTIGLYHTLGQLTFTDIDVYGVAPAYRWVVMSPATWLVVGTLVAGLGILLLAATARRRPVTYPAATA